MIIILIFMIVLMTLRFFPLVGIRGESMLPAYQHGDILFSRRMFGKKECEVGKVYVFRPPYDKPKFVVKRLIGIVDGKYFFEGDNKEFSKDSSEYGLIEPERVFAEIKGFLYRRKNAKPSFSISSQVSKY